VRRLPAILLIFVFLACGVARGEDRPPTLFQYSTINALLHGLYDGDLTFEELAAHGSFGIGTVNRLDGEMVALDGVFYQVRADGRAYRAAPDAMTPFAVVTDFAPDREAPLGEGLGFGDLEERIDATIGSPNRFVAIRVDGVFRNMKVRSVPAQTPPYKPLADVIAGQVVFELADVSGTMVGFRMPDYMSTLNVPGYHFHFLTDDRTRGGHVLDFETVNGRIALAEIDDFRLSLPGDPAFADADLAGDRKDEIEKVEKSD